MSPGDIQLPRGGVVIGVGADIIEVERIRRVFDRHPERFLDRVFTQEERDYCMGMAHPHPHLAARFAAKEAVSKAFTTGIGKELGWKSISIRRGERGEPHVVLDEQGRVLLEKVGGTEVLISLSHTENYGHAVALLVKA